jgi:hypothetical protein
MFLKKQKKTNKTKQNKKTKTKKQDKTSPIEFLLSV